MQSINISGIQKTFNNIYYVDVLNGSDSNIGTESSPFVTVAHAITKCANNGDCIFAKEGTYNTTRISGAYDSGGLSDEGKEITFVGQPGKTIFVCDGRLHSGRDSHCIMFQNANTEAYHIIFDFYTNDRTNNYSCSIAGINAETGVKGRVYNCVFNMNVKTSSLTYSNSGISVTEFHNCLFISPQNFTNSYSGDGAQLINCACTKSFYSSNKKTNVIENVQYNPDTYTLLDESVNEVVGVMSGEYPWKSFLERMLIKSNDFMYTMLGASKQKKGENIAIASNISSITANTGYYPDRVISGQYNGYPSSYGWYCPPGITNAYLTIEFKNPQIVDTVDIVSYYIGGYEAIKDFDLLGSDTGAFNGEEKNLGSAIHPNDTTADYIRHQFKNNRAYKFYRIHVRSIYPGNGNNDLSIHDLKMFLTGYGAVGLTRLDEASIETFEQYGMKKIEVGVLESVVYKTREHTIRLTRKPLTILCE